MKLSLLALAFSIAGATAQQLAIAPAVELSFTANPARTHALQSSSDLMQWVSAGSEVVASDAEVRRYFAAAEKSKFFRLQSSDLRELKGELEVIRAKHKAPALACAVIRSNAVVGLGVTGNRKWNIAEPATLNDKWHQGSLTKSMTAALAGLMVDRGDIQWSTRITNIFPELAAGMHATWKEVTLEQLLSHRAGAPGDLNSSGIWGELWNHEGTPKEQRMHLLRRVTALQTDRAPGAGYGYSNAGYAIAGAMLERVAGKPWEELITAELFRPLDMGSAGFGVPATPRYIDHPWGHVYRNGAPSPIAPGKDADNPPAIGPGGTVHCTLLDMARYAAFHLAGSRGEGAFLKPDTYRKLYTDVASQGYGLGWGVSSRSWADGKTLQHTGSNTQWYSNVWIAPNKNFAVVILTNIGGDQAFACTDEVAAKMIQLFL